MLPDPAAELLVGRIRLEVPEARAFDKFGRLLAQPARLAVKTLRLDKRRAIADAAERPEAGLFL